MERPRTVLIADDHPIFRTGLREVIALDPRISLTAEAGDGLEAWRLIQQAKPDVAVLDLDMPRLGGLQLARKVLEARLKVALIILTMYKEGRIFNEAIEAGILGYVLKENAADDLLECIQSVLAGRAFISPSLSSLLLQRGTIAKGLLEAKPQLQTLTATERRILSHIGENLTSKEIADRIGISMHTVENHRANICRKLNLHGSHSLLKFAFDNKQRLKSSE
jgi:DNA-binding NarL/FixJ family response regulator